MINILIPITQNAKGYKKIIADLSSNEEAEIFIGVISSQKNALQYPNRDNIHVIEYDNSAKREEIINSMQKYIQVGELFIIRKPITYNEFKDFLKNDRDIVVCKTNLSPIKKFFFMIWQKILRLCLGVRLYDGDTSAIYFGEDLAAVLAQSNNLSYSSRVDRWRGVDQGSVIVEGEPVKTEVDKKENIKYLLFGLFALILGAAVTTVVAIFARVNVIIGLFLFCIDAICLAVFLLLLVVIIFNTVVGKKKFSSALELSYIAGFEDIQIAEDDETNDFELEEDDEDEEN